MASRIRDLLVLFLPSEWIGGGIRVGAASPGPPGAPPPPQPPGPPPELRDIFELRMIAQLLLARLGGPITLGEMEPRSLAEINELEARLTAALEELKSTRARLEKR